MLTVTPPIPLTVTIPGPPAAQKVLPMPYVDSMLPLLPWDNLWSGLPAVRSEMEAGELAVSWEALEHPRVMQPEAPTISTAGGVAVIRAAGVMTKRPNAWLLACGGTPALWLCTAIREAAADPHIVGVVLDLSNLVAGAHGSEPCISEEIALCGKPVAAWISGRGCGAAVMIGASCDAFWASPTAAIGAAGWWVVEPSRHLSSHYGAPSTTHQPAAFEVPEVSRREQAKLSAALSAVHAELLIERRGMMPVEAMGVAHGAVWSAEQAQAARLIDDLVPTREVAVDRVARGDVGRAAR